MKDTPHLISNCLLENETRNDQPVTENDYMTNMANIIIYDDTGFAMEYRQIIKTQNSDQFGSNTSPVI